VPRELGMAREHVACRQSLRMQLAKIDVVQALAGREQLGGRRAGGGREGARAARSAAVRAPGTSAKCTCNVLLAMD
jgi:hypothetical protein